MKSKKRSTTHRNGEAIFSVWMTPPEREQLVEISERLKKSKSEIVRSLIFTAATAILPEVHQ